MSVKTALITHISTFIVGVVIGIFIYYGYKKHNEVIINDPRIDSIEYRIDSIRTVIDTIYVEKEKIKYIYETKIDSIYNQSADEDWIYFNNYLSSKFPNN